MLPLEIILKILVMKVMKILSTGVSSLILAPALTSKITVRLEKHQQSQILSSFSDLVLSVSNIHMEVILLMLLRLLLDQVSMIACNNHINIDRKFSSLRDLLALRTVLESQINFLFQTINFWTLALLNITLEKQGLLTLNIKL